MNTLLSYIKKEKRVLLIVTITGLIYNIGLLAGPYLEGKMSATLVNILTNKPIVHSMLFYVGIYILCIFVVQVNRYFKRNYVRIFANNTNKQMKECLYSHLLRLSPLDLQKEGVGNLLTKALSDVDDCSEGMRKFITEIFDTGIALCAYVAMLIYYDFKLALLCLFFTIVSYIVAEKMKHVVQKTSTAYKKVAGSVNEETLDRIENSVTYRVYGVEDNREKDYENVLKDYESASIKAELPSAFLPPLYKLITLISVLCIMYFGSKNVLSNVWDIASFTTFLSCFIKMADKSSKSAKLFNAVQKAKVSWDRIKDYMVNEKYDDSLTEIDVKELSFIDVSFEYPNGPLLLNNVNFKAEKGQIIGITGKIACGKTTLGKLLLNNYPYTGNIYLDKRELRTIPSNQSFLTYFGHEPQLFNDTISNNIALGKDIDVIYYLKLVCMDEEVKKMEKGIDTIIGDKGSHLSGGQAQRLALARTLAHAKAILVLDDPFSSLDKKTEESIFLNLKKDYKQSIILFISHRVSLFKDVDKVLYIDDGNCCFDLHTSLMQKQLAYKNIVEIYVGEEND